MEKYHLNKEAELTTATNKTGDIKKKLVSTAATQVDLGLEHFKEETNSKISTLEMEALKNEESYETHYEEMIFKITDLMSAIEHANETLYKANENF